MTTKSLNRCMIFFLLTIVVSGCGKPPAELDSTVPSALLQRLQITEWDLSSHVGEMVTIHVEDEDDGAIKFPVADDTRLVTQLSGVHEQVLVYVIDSTGVGSTAIKTYERTNGLRTGDIASGELYRYNNQAVVMIKFENDDGKSTN